MRTRYASATSNSVHRPNNDDNDRYKRQRIVLDAPHVLLLTISHPDPNPDLTRTLTMILPLTTAQS